MNAPHVRHGRAEVAAVSVVTVVNAPKALVRLLSGALIATSVVLAAQTAAPAKPDVTRFTPVTIVQPGELDEPMAFEVLPSGKVYIIERKGAFKVYDPATKVTRIVETLPVNTKYFGADGVAKEAEEGLIGLTLDPHFADNHFIYMLLSLIHI